MKKKRRGERGNERGGKGGKGEMKNKGEVRGERKYGDRRGIRGEGRGGGVQSHMYARALLSLSPYQSTVLINDAISPNF